VLGGYLGIDLVRRQGCLGRAVDVLSQGESECVLFPALRDDRFHLRRQELNLF